MKPLSARSDRRVTIRPGRPLIARRARLNDCSAVDPRVCGGARRTGEADCRSRTPARASSAELRHDVQAALDGLAGRQRLRGRRVRRKAGGQPGHPGHHRELVPLERVDAVVDLVPETCRRCAHRLNARDDEGDPRRHQVTEVPPIAAHITEYRCHRRHCPACGTRTVAAPPDECAGQFGPQLAALIAYLTVVCRLPRLVVQRLLADVLQIPLSLGSTQHAWEEASAAVAAPYKELRQALANQPVLNADGPSDERGETLALDTRPQPLCLYHRHLAWSRRPAALARARPLPASWAATDRRTSYPAPIANSVGRISGAIS